jgi:glycosyltransferase involved in cell wall biosynthesis
VSETLVSVLIPCYQQGHALPGAIDSVVTQTHLQWEIVLVNDGSTDATRETAERMGRDLGDRLRYLEQENRGQSRARHAGLAIARGDYLVQLDADDLLEPEMMAACVAAFEAEPANDVVVANATLIDEAGAVLQPFDQSRSLPWPAILDYNPHGALAATMAKTASVREVGGLLAGEVSGVEDWDLWARMARCAMRFGAVARPLARYRQGAAGYSRRAERMLRSTIDLYDRCRKDDPRLAQSSRAPAPPIDEALYQRLRNGRTMHALGVCAAGGGGAEDWAQILDYLAEGNFDPSYARTQFAWGCRQALQGTEAGGCEAGRAKAVSEAVKAAFEKRELAEHARTTAQWVERILTDPWRPDPLIERVTRGLARWTGGSGPGGRI